MTAFSSVLVIALTVLPYVMKSPTEIADLYNLVTIALSLTILVASLRQYSTGGAVNAEQHHRSGLEINEIFRIVHLKAVNGVVTSSELEHFNERFNAVLQKYTVNHDEIDYLKYQLDHSEENPWLGRIGQTRIWLRLIWYKYLPTGFLAVVILFVAWLVFCYEPKHPKTAEPAVSRPAEGAPLSTTRGTGKMVEEPEVPPK